MKKFKKYHMDIQTQKLRLIEKLLKIENESLILKMLSLLDFAEKEEQIGRLTPMSLERFYQKLENSELAIQNGETIAQEDLRRKAKNWKKE